MMQAIAAEHGGSAFEWATRPEDRTRLWKARHSAYYASKACYPGKEAFATDACVPISRLADCVLESKADADATGLISPIVGHVGDGNFHLLILIDQDNADEVAGSMRSIMRRWHLDCYAEAPRVAGTSMAGPPYVV